MPCLCLENRKCSSPPMQGTGRVLSRLSAAWAFIAGAAILAGAAASVVHARDAVEDVAMAVPRVSPLGASGVALPQPLPPSEAARIRTIFGMQRRADPAAAGETARLSDTLLLGHLLADRLTRAGAVAPADQLGAWLVHYPDLPDAPALYSLLVAYALVQALVLTLMLCSFVQRW